MRSSEGYKDEDLVVATFLLNDAVYATEMLCIIEVIRLVKITQLPESSSYLKGIINHRGKVVPVICLRDRLGLPYDDYNQKTEIIITVLNDQYYGFIVDSVCEISTVKRSTISLPEIVSGTDDSIIGMIKENENLIVLLDFSKLI